jgi:hypothetical protein
LIVNKQIEESIKGVKNIEYHSQFAVPPSSTAPTYVAGSSAAAPDAAAVPATAAPPNFHLCHAEKVSVIPHMHFGGSPFSFCTKFLGAICFFM